MSVDEGDATSAMIFAKRSDKIDTAKHRTGLANLDGLTAGGVLAILAGATKKGLAVYHQLIGPMRTEPLKTLRTVVP